MPNIIQPGQRLPIETLSPEKRYWLRKWIGKQPGGSSILRDLSEDQIVRWLCCALTLADWLLPYRERLLKKPKPRLVLIGASAKAEAVSQGQDLRYVAPLLGLPRLDIHLVGRECSTGLMQPGTAEYPSQIRAFRNNWHEVEAREIAEGMDAAFLFHPGLHTTLENGLPYIPKEHGSDLLETGCLKAIVRAGLPLGMSAFHLKDGQKDCKKLDAYGFTTANFRENRWGLRDASPAVREDTGEILRDEDGEILYHANSLYLVDIIGLSDGVSNVSSDVGP
jgi:hypothetical protein